MPTRRTVTRAGVELVYWTWPGGDPPVLALHGIGNYGRYWDLFADALAGRRRLVAPDARGHGESGRLAEGYAPDDFVADAMAGPDASAIQRAVVMGHSMGGLHAIQLAARHRDRVRAIVIVAGGAEPIAEGNERARRLLTGRPPRFASPAEARAYLERTSPGYTEAVYVNRLAWAFREEAGELVWRSDPNALAEIMRSRVAPPERWQMLGAIRLPALVVRGTRSNVLSADVARRIARTLDHGRLIELDAGHNVALERPSELPEAVLALSG